MLEDHLEERFDFTGCKIAFAFVRGKFDHLAMIKKRFLTPNMWDLPGGGREENETTF